jgi:SpoVK/Ycf46/Vps4 family AAA+-type ATPase
MNPSDPKEPQVGEMPLHYKHRDMKIYSSDEWMADATKKYRKMFDRYETTYIWIEFSFFNKLFDEGEWDAAVKLKCFFLSGTERRELCSLDQPRKVLRDENIVYIRGSWGNPTAGAYWLRGDYLWVAYIDDVKIGEAKFHVEDLGLSNPGENLFFDIESIKLFEGDAEASSVADKKYLTQFKKADTRHVWVEFEFKNKTTKDYWAEIFFNYYNDAGQLKGSYPYLTFVTANTAGQVYTLYPGWGNNAPGRWGNDNYTVEVVFLDNLLATVPFSIGERLIEGNPTIISGQEIISKAMQPNTASNATKTNEDLLYESLNELNSLTGLVQIKTEVNEMVQLVKFYQETGKDVLSRFSLHTVFTGNPGTGKTTVARILAKIYKGLGVLEKGHLVEVDREGLVAGYVGQTAIKTAEKVTEAMGGVLFIDEAYSLANSHGSQYDFGAEAIQIILKRMEDFRGKFGVIVAGYTGNMYEFISSNPGLKSRFDKYFEFPDYTPDEMMVIAMSMFKKEDVDPDPAATEHLKNFFAFLHANRDHHFGNARTVRQVVGESVKNQNLRLAAMKKADRTPELMRSLILDDVLEFQIKETAKQSYSKIGFRTSGN